MQYKIIYHGRDGTFPEKQENLFMYFTKSTYQRRKSYTISLIHAEKVFDKTFSIKYLYKQDNFLNRKGGI